MVKRKMQTLTFCCRAVGFLLAFCIGVRGQIATPNLAFTRQPPQQVDFSNTTGSQVECLVHGNPHPVLFWTLSDGSRVADVPRLRHVLPNGTLVFSPFRAEDYRQDIHAAVYKCVATNSAGTIVSRNLRIRAVVMQHYEIQVYDEFVISGNTAVLKCHVPTFISEYVSVTSWIKEDNYRRPSLETVKTGDKYTILLSGELHIQDVHSMDSQSTYKCQTTHRLTKESRLSSTAGRLIVTDARGSVPPRITDSKPAIFGREGETVILPCAAQGHPVPHYRWITRSNHGKEILVIPFKKYVQIGGNLIMENVQKADSGIYECSVNNSVGSEKVETVLTVTAPLSAFIQPYFQVVDIGRPATLDCITAGYPISSISWFKNGKPFRSDHSTPRDSIRFNSVTKDDKGIYQCFVSNDWETVEATGELQLGDSVPSLLETFQERSLHPGPSISLRCVGSGTPLPEFSWKVDDIAISQDSRHRIGEIVNSAGNVISMLNISSVLTEDGGIYTCTAKNRIGQVEYSALMNVYGPPVIRSLPPILVVAGHNLTLRCPISSYPVDTIIWQKGGKTIPINRRQIVFQNGTLHIRAVQRDPDAGKYTCIVQTKDGMSAQKDFQIRVLIPPKIMPFSLQDSVLHEGMRVQLFCAVIEGDLPITIEWLKDGKPIPPFLQVTTNNLDKYSSSLIIAKVSSQHGGNYTCVAQNAATTVKHTAPLYVHVPPKINPFTFQEKHLHEGTHARLVCGVIQGDLPLNFFWLKDGRAITNDEQKVAIREIDEFSSILTIKGASPWHSGNYTCIAKNQAGVVNYTSYLTVNVPPRWILEPRDTSVTIGQRITLDCQADGFPHPVVNWMKAVDDAPGEYRDLYDLTSRISHFDNGTLLIKDIQQADEGKYLCQATNGIESGLSTVIFLDVQVPAHFKHRTMNVTSKRGSSSKLQCNVTGDKSISVTWTVNGKKLTTITTNARYQLEEYPTPSGLVSELILMQVDRKDSALYTCLAENHFGRDEMFISLAVQERPEFPMGLKIIDQNSRSTQVSWLKPYDGNSGILRYVLQFKRVSGGWLEASTNVTVPGTETGVTIQGLQPATPYHIRIFAENDVGSSDPSEALLLNTTEEAPSGPPQDIQTKEIDSQTLKVSWKPPKKDMWNGLIRGYHVGYKVADSIDPFVYKTVENYISNNNVHSIELTNLKKYTKYNIVVQAFNHIGSGPKSEELTIVTAEGVPQSPPTDIKCSPLSSQSLHISWEPPLATTINGVLQGYRVIYIPSEEWYGAAQPESKTTPASKTILHGLQKNTNYSVHVLASNRVGDSNKSETVFCKTNEDVPDAPADIKAVVSSHDSILVAWRNPIQPNGILLKYTVYMRSSDHGKEDTVKHTVSGTENQFEAVNLKKNTRYEFWITAATSVGEGQSTRVITQMLKTSMVPAKAVSFDSEIIVPFKTVVELQCKAVGKPFPDRTWKYEDKLLEVSERFRIGKDGILRIFNVEVTDAGTYICTIKNSYGTDEVKYRLVVQVPPSAPSLVVITATHVTLVLSWKPGIEGGDNIRGYAIHYKRDYGEWEMLRIKPEHETFTLKDLDCGTRYQLYMTAFNKIGMGSPSEAILTKTKGAPPEGPPKFKLVRVNSTFVTLRLEAWSDGGCPIIHFVVEYKPKSETSWRLVANNVPPTQTHFLIPDLTPATWYSLRVTAHNSAGSTNVEYEFATHTMSGDALVPSTVLDEEKDEEKAFLVNLSLLALIGAAIGVVVLVTLLTCLCARKRRHPGRKSPVSGVLQQNNAQPVELKPLHGPKFHKNLTMGSFTCLLRGADHGKQQLHINQNSQKNVSRDMLAEEVSPYATSQLPGCKGEREKLHVFHQRHFEPEFQLRNKMPEMMPLKTVRTQNVPFCQRPDSLLLEKSSYGDLTREDENCLGVTEIPESMPTLYALRPSAPIYGDHHVPDLLDHGPESSSSESSPESRRRTYPHYGSAGSRLSSRHIQSPSMVHELRQIGGVKEAAFLLSPSNHYCDMLTPNMQPDRWDLIPKYCSDSEMKNFQRIHSMEKTHPVSNRYQNNEGSPISHDEDDFTIPV